MGNKQGDWTLWLEKTSRFLGMFFTLYACIAMVAKGERAKILKTLFSALTFPAFKRETICDHRDALGIGGLALDVGNGVAEVFL